MNRSGLNKSLIALQIAALIVGITAEAAEQVTKGAQAVASLDGQPARSSERDLDLAARLIPPLSALMQGRGALLLALDFANGVLHVDFTAEAVGNRGDSEVADLQDEIDRVVSKALDEAGTGSLPSIEYELVVDGVPLFERVHTLQRYALPRAVSGQTIVLSPGHGYYETTSGGWSLQRQYWFGIVEDFINLDLVAELHSLLAGSGADRRPVRQLNKAAGDHGSGHDWWQMGASEYVRSLGAPWSVWNAGFNGVDRDIVARPEYANYIGADIMISIHNNGSGACGTETWYDTTNGYQDDSRALATSIQSKLIERLRSQWNSGWCDRGVKGSAGGYGENRRFDGPAVIVELAFMDTQSDNAALQNATFRRIAMTAIRDALSGGTSADLEVTALTAPSTATIGGQIAISATVANQGTASTGAYRLGFYFSTDATITTSDTFAASCAMSALGSGDSRACSGPVTVPSSLSDGTYYFGALADDLGVVVESSDTNNFASRLVTVITEPTVDVFGPISYLSETDSPFPLGNRGMRLEDFEDAEWSPGWNAIGGTICGPSCFTDSVDADDGQIDGSGRDGRSFCYGPKCPSKDSDLLATFIFDSAPSGHYPTYAGIVWTDSLNFEDTYGQFSVEFLWLLAPGCGLVETLLVANPGDQLFDGQTSEDIFVGLHDDNGICGLSVRTTGDANYVELDHLQYGTPVPEPRGSSLALVILMALKWLRFARCEWMHAWTVSTEPRSASLARSDH